MNRLSIVIVLAIWILPMSLFSTNTYAAGNNGSQSGDDHQALLNTIDLLYKNGLIDADIIDAPIVKILDEIKAITGVRISVYDRSILASRLSATLKGVPLDKAIRIILEGFSYALYPLNDTFAIVVLSKVPETIIINRRVTSEQEVGDQSAADVNNATAPKSLDDFQRINMEERWLNLDHAGQESTEDSEQLAIEMDRNFNALFPVMRRI